MINLSSSLQKAQCGRLPSCCTAALFRPTWTSLPDRLCWLKFLSQASRDLCDIFCHLLAYCRPL